MNPSEIGYFKSMVAKQNKRKRQTYSKSCDNSNLPISDITDLDKEIVQKLNKSIKHIIASQKDPFSKASEYIVFEEHRILNPLYEMNLMFLELDRIFKRKVGREKYKYIVKRLYFTCKNHLINPVSWIRHLEESYLNNIAYKAVEMVSDDTAKELFGDYLLLQKKIEKPVFLGNKIEKMIGGLNYDRNITIS